LSLLVLEPKLTEDFRYSLHGKVEKAFNSIEEPAPIVSLVMLKTGIEDKNCPYHRLLML
jgi:hypothetical protein